MIENDASKQSEPTQELSARLRLERVAKNRGVDLQIVVLEALEQYLEREEDRAEWIQQGDDALKHFNQTGLHLTGAEVDDWLARLEGATMWTSSMPHLKWSDASIRDLQRL